ncbi:MAG: Gfo/Idh/MocA family protein, partial [Solirubrobacterales bacterium]
MRPPRTRVAVAGHTGRGDYGHELDRAFLGIATAEVVAVADPDERGRVAAMSRIGARRGYASLAELLEREQPEVVVVAPRHLDRHRELVLAACEHGAHVLCEKPLAPDLEAADEMVEAADRAGACLAVALPWAHEARAEIVAELLAAGAIGELLG